jgi:hypothetical protein
MKLSDAKLNVFAVRGAYAEWRAACRELAGWVRELAMPEASSTEGRASLRAKLLLRLQHVDAWPFPTGELLGTFPRALWSLWQPITGHRPERRCTWPECTHLLPADAHGNRHLCDDHRLEALRLRSERNRRKRAQQAPSGAH